jgi:hypothetical protein
MRPFVLALLASTVLAALPAAAAAQQQPQQGDPPLTPAEVQKLFDGYAVIQAQEFLNLSDQAFGSFLPRLRALQEARRRGEQERFRLIQELDRLTSPRAAAQGNANDGAVRERLRSLRDSESRSFAEVQKAREAIDEVLDVRQQARFRIFEGRLEQRKLQLLMQARQANRAQRQGARPAQ